MSGLSSEAVIIIIVVVIIVIIIVVISVVRNKIIFQFYHFNVLFCMIRFVAFVENVKIVADGHEKKNMNRKKNNGKQR